ncbi:MAG: hypothetical protein Kow0042_15350 [Calditrichia bacterium]
MCTVGGNGFVFTVSSGHSNIIITGNYFYSTAATKVVNIQSNCNNIQINNNYIYSENDGSIYADPSSSIEAWNNVIGGDVEI